MSDSELGNKMRRAIIFCNSLDKTSPLKFKLKQEDFKGKYFSESTKF